MERNINDTCGRAKKEEAAFKRNLFGFVVLNTFFWTTWLFTAGQDYFNTLRGIPWPAWITAAWSIGIVFHYYTAVQRYKQRSNESETGNEEPRS